MALKSEHIRLVDVGCSGGLAPGWRAFGGNLEAVAFDCDAEEIARLQREEANPAVQYVSGFVGMPAAHSLRAKMPEGVYLHDWPIGRLAHERTANIREEKRRGASPPALGEYLKTSVSAGASSDMDYRLPSSGAEQIVLPDFLQAHGYAEFDFLKIDVDGPDFEILQTMEEALAAPGLLGVSLEVNFIGSALDSDHAFHNTDRFLRARGFDLFQLSIRQYGSSALPWPYSTERPGCTIGGRPVQGDATYLRDLSSPVRADVAAAVTDEKLLKLAAIFSLCGLPDEAAEVLIVHRDRLSALLDIDAGLELLAQQIQANDGGTLTYADYIAASEAEDPAFFNYNDRQSQWLARLISAKAELEALKESSAREIAALQAQLASAPDRGRMAG